MHIYKMYVFSLLSSVFALVNAADIKGSNSSSENLPIECGKAKSEGNGPRFEMPWSASIYSKKSTPFQRICGGSIITTQMVVTAAHCFWNEVEGLQPTSEYAVASGKLYSPWDHSDDGNAQKSDVKNIKIFPRFRGSQTNYQGDIALVSLSTAFHYNEYVLPICLDLGEYIEENQLEVGKLGRVASVGEVGNGMSSQKLKVVELPFLKFDKCISEAPVDFRLFITIDKICAGHKEGSKICKGDGGSGLAFSKEEKGETRYYLRGILSLAPPGRELCNVYGVTLYTSISSHRNFIAEHMENTPL